VSHRLKDRWGAADRYSYEILRRPDGPLDLFHNREATGRSIPDKRLQDQWARPGICGQQYRDIRHKLEDGGEARLVLRDWTNQDEAKNEG